jgi:baculoviral IAP repeat-containing protein 6
MKRLVQEISALSSGLPLFLESTVLLRVDSERMDVMQSIITGPEGTPYAHGCFQFDIYCPPEYPSVPPVVNLQTTGNGSVRFNPNLYNCGKVCLSLLGTWRGSQNEKWNENASTLLQVFVSIQSLIFVDHPYFNEPGYESTMNTPKGDQQSRLYNEAIRMATVRWAMIDMLQNPTPGFEDAILCHFKLKRNRILKEVGEWVSEAKSTSYADKLQKLFDELKEELRAVDPDTPMPSDVVATPDSVDSNTANSMESEDKEVQRWNNAVSLADFVPGYTLALYVTVRLANCYLQTAQATNEYFPNFVAGSEK